MSIADSANAFGASATVSIGGKTWIVSAPTGPEELLIAYEYRRQIMEEAKTPLQAIAGDLQGLPMGMVKMAIDAAVAAQAAGIGGKAEPTDEAIGGRQFHVDGLRFRFWVLAKKNHPELTLDMVRELITPGMVDAVNNQLWLAMRRKVDDEKKA